MAFDQPLEADRVDDLNLFTTLIRAPVVGALFWFLGGEEAKQKNEEEKRFREQLFLGDSSESTTPVDHVPADSLSSSHSFVDNCRKSSMKKAAPSMAESDVSHDDYVVERCQESLDRMNLQECPNHTLKRKKELSWSEHLVEYAGEVRLRIVIVRYVWLSVQVIAFVLVRALGCCCFVARSGLALECDERLRLMSVLFGGSAVSIQAEIRPFFEAHSTRLSVRDSAPSHGREVVATNIAKAMECRSCVVVEWPRMSFRSLGFRPAEFVSRKRAPLWLGGIFRRRSGVAPRG